MKGLLKIILSLLCISSTIVNSSYGDCECKCDDRSDRWKGITTDEIPIYFKTFDITKHDEQFNGHTMEKHIGKSKDWLDGRLAGSKHEKFVSSYSDSATANDVIREVILENQDKIKEWLQDEDQDKLLLTKKFDNKIGVVMKKKDKEIQDCNVGVIVLKRPHRVSEKFYIVTSYPVANVGDVESEDKQWKVKNTPKYSDKYQIKR